MHNEPPSLVLCHQCAELNSSKAVACSQCGHEISITDLEIIYGYSKHLVYYGHQYRIYYEAQRGRPDKLRPSLAFVGDAFAWLGSAVLSGLIGNISYDLLKATLFKIRESAKKNSAYDEGCKRLSEMSDAEIEKFIEQIHDAHNGFKNTNPEVVADIREEILADAVAEDPVISHQIGKLIFRENVKPKHRKRALELYKLALQKKLSIQKPLRKDFEGFWGKVE